MLSFRGLLVPAAASVWLLAVVIGEAGGQTPGNTEPTAAEMAKAIAHAIDAKALKMPDAPIAFESATSHDNFVEVRYSVKDARLFPHSKAEGDKRRLGQVGYYCFDRQIQLFKNNGVVIHQVLTAPDGSAPFEFTVDQSTCASLVAGVKTLSETAQRERSKSIYLTPGSTSPIEPKRVTTTTIRSPTAPNSLTEPKPVRTMTIHTNGADEKLIESPQSPTGPNWLTKP